MSAIALALSALTPDLSAMTETLTSPQHTADLRGPDAVVDAAAGLVAWAVWAWGAAGLALTAISALPGVLGGSARFLLRAVLPAAARRSAALALGLGLGVVGPALGPAFLGAPAATAAPAGSTAPAADGAATPGAVPDWPGHAVPDWPDAAAADEHVVVRGDCLWHIAAADLRDRHGVDPSAADVAAAVHAWWTANEAVIGPDPDLLLPGQVLRAPGPP
jgi:nucleoid-associated protein YgaU